jgi:hypothetical protein
MATQLPSARHQAALSLPTGTRRWSRFTFSRGGLTRELEPVGGSLTQDVRRGARWDGQLTFAGDSTLPKRPGDLLTPFGTRVQVELGLELLDGSISTVPYGTYEISSARTRIDAGARVVDVGLIDISDQIERYRFETPLTINSGTELADLVNIVVIDRTGRNPGTPVTGSSIGAPRIFGLDPGTGPWSEVLDVLNGFSRTAWFDRVGTIQIGTLIADAATAYPLDLLTSLSADFDTRPPNVVVARGEAQDGTVPVQAVAIDSDPSSPTYAGTGPGTSPYGRVTEYFASPLLETVSQAQAAANTILSKNVGAAATYKLIRPYDPTISAGDVVSVDGSALAVDAVTLDLSGDTLLQVREI